MTCPDVSTSVRVIQACQPEGDVMTQRPEMHRLIHMRNGEICAIRDILREAILTPGRFGDSQYEVLSGLMPRWMQLATSMTMGDRRQYLKSDLPKEIREALEEAEHFHKVFETLYGPRAAETS